MVLLGYAQYFNSDTDDCTAEDWTIFSLPGHRQMTKENRALYNTLVKDTNHHLETVANHFANIASRMTLITANWDPWPSLVGGRFCEPGASPVSWTLHLIERRCFASTPSFLNPD